MTPILDPKPTGRAHDWAYEKIKTLKAAPEIPRPISWKNILALELCKRDQYNRGICGGEAGAYGYDTFYMMLTGEMPTEADKKAYIINTVDQVGTVHDELYPQSASAECFYQKSREIGNVTYPSGTELRWVVRAWQEYGMNIETQWHTDKMGNHVWMKPQTTNDGGITPDEAALFAAKHRSTGYAMIEDVTWGNVCQAIYEKGFVLMGIPIYANFDSMRWKDGTFPDPDKDGNWGVSGYHAIFVYGYDDDWLYMVHSWGNWCGQFGKFSRHYFDVAKQEWLEAWVVLDDADVRIARGYYVPMNIYSNVMGTELYIDEIMRGYAPLTISIVHDQQYTIRAHAAGYIEQTLPMNSDMMEVVFKLLPLPTPVPWWKGILESILNILKKIFGG